MMRRLTSMLPIALWLALPGVAHAAPTDEEVKAMQQRIQSLESKLEQMQKLLEARPAPAAPAAVAQAGAAPQWGDPAQAPAKLSQQELDAMKQKLARQELKVDKLYTESTEGAGAGLEVSGYLDPWYVVNKNQNTASFQFLNGDPYTYYNSSQGDVFLRIVKTFGEGPSAPKVDIQIAPSRGYGTDNTNSDGYAFASIFHQALFYAPVNDLWTFNAGFTAGYSGYEYFESTLMQTITHNLLYDFALGGSQVGAGMIYTKGDWIVKAFLGNEQYFTIGSIAAPDQANRTPTLTARVDYTWNSALYLGGSMAIGRNTLYGPLEGCADGGYGYQCTSAKPYSTRATIGMDLTYLTADAQYNAEWDVGTVQNGAWNGGNALWWGLSGQAHQQWSTAALGRIGATLRLDYLNNQRNGGGTSSLYLANDTNPGTDTSNGFGIDPACYASDVDADGNSNNGRNCKGANRYALSAAFSAYPTEKWTLKAEYRYDWSNLRVFGTSDGQLRKNNSVFSLATVYAF